MSTFASVVRKPGQKITPRAAPRRNVRRPVPDTPPDASEPGISTPENTSDGAQQEPVGVEDRLPTPPATSVEQQSPVPEASAQGRSESVLPDVVTVVVEQPRVRAGAKRRAVENENETGAEAESENESGGAGASKRRRVSAREESQRAAAEIQDLLQRSRTQASAVSELSHSIDRDTDRRLQSNPRPDSSTLADSGAAADEPEDAEDAEDAEQSRSSSRMDALAAAVVNGTSRPRARRQQHRRGLTPEQAEDYEIDPAKVQMADLTRDSGLGKRSETGKRLEAEWVEIKERWDDHAANNRQAALNKRAKESEQQKQQAASIGAEPQEQMMTIVNNQIVFVEGAREVAFHDDHEQRAEEGAQAAKADEPIYRYVNQNRIGKKAGKLGAKVARWDDETTDLFYKGLRMFGTDFEMIACMLFPGKTRKEIKDKFVREERKNHARVIENTRQREAVDVAELIKHSDVGQLKDPDALQREMQAEEERLRREHEEKRAQQNGDGLGVDDDGDGDADQPLPSIELDEQGLGEGDEGDESENGDNEEENEGRGGIQGLAASVLGTGRSKRQQQQQQQPPRKTRQGGRKATGTKDTGGKAAKVSRRGKKPFEGVEERIGTIDDVAL